MKRMVRRVATVCALAASTAIPAQETNPLAFEVASVRPSSGTRVSRRVTDTRVDLVNYPLRALLLMALRVTEYQLVAPDWVRDVRVDISATLPPGASRAQVPVMLQDVLRRRFGAAWHVEQRPLEAYDLRVGTDGISAREVPPHDELYTAPPAGVVAATPISEDVDGPYRSFVIGAGATTVTATSVYTQFTTPQQQITLDAKRMTMDDFARLLQFTMDAPVVDRTGLSGGYAFKIDLPLAATIIRMRVTTGRTTARDGAPLTVPLSISAPDAVKQIGLLLERRRTTSDVMVIDKLERIPTPN